MISPRDYIFPEEHFSNCVILVISTQQTQDVESTVWRCSSFFFAETTIYSFGACIYNNKCASKKCICLGEETLSYHKGPYGSGNTKCFEYKHNYIKNYFTTITCHVFNKFRHGWFPPNIRLNIYVLCICWFGILRLNDTSPQEHYKVYIHGVAHWRRFCESTFRNHKNNTNNNLNFIINKFPLSFLYFNNNKKKSLYKLP